MAGSTELNAAVFGFSGALDGLGHQLGGDLSLSFSFGWWGSGSVTWLLAFVNICSTSR